MYSYLYLYLLIYRAHVSISFGFPESVSFLGNPSLYTMRLTPPQGLRDVQGYPVPNFCLTLNEGLHCSIGFIEGGTLVTRPMLGSYPYRFGQANNLSRLVRYNDGSDVDSLSIHIQLCSMGFSARFRVTTFYPCFTD